MIGIFGIIKKLVYLLKTEKFASYLKTTFTGWTIKILAGLSKSFLLILSVRYLNINDYSTLALFWSLGSWFILCSVGLGDALQNHISHCRAIQKNYDQLIENLSLLIWPIALFFSFLFLLFYQPLYYLLFHRIPNVTLSPHLFSCLGIINILTILFSIFYRISLAEHKGHYYFIYTNIGSILSAIITFLFLHFFKNKNLLYIILLSWTLPSFFVSLGNYFQYFKIKKIIYLLSKTPAWIKDPLLFEKLKSSELMILIHRGSQFWLSYLISSFTFYLDYIIMAQTLQAKDIAIYNILDKTYRFLYEFYSIFLLSIWPILAERHSKQDWQAGQHLLTSKLNQGVLFIIILTASILFFKPYLLIVLKNPDLTLLSPTILLFCFINIARMYRDTYCLGLYSQNRMKTILINLFFQALLSITILFYSSRYFGLNGLLVGELIVYISTSILFLPYIYPRTQSTKIIS